MTPFREFSTEGTWLNSLAEGLDVLGFLSVISDMILFGQIVKAPPKVEPDKAKQARKPRRKPVSKKRQPKRKTRKK